MISRVAKRAAARHRQAILLEQPGDGWNRPGGQVKVQVWEPSLPTGTGSWSPVIDITVLPGEYDKQLVDAIDAADQQLGYHLQGLVDGEHFDDVSAIDFPSGGSLSGPGRRIELDDGTFVILQGGPFAAF
jgi:hypothetical protein